VVTVTPGSTSITTVQALSQLPVTVTVSGTSGTPTGSVTLSAGTYTSSAVILTAGSASINIPAGSLTAGTDTLTASYTPDAASSSTYKSNSGTNQVTVNKVTPTVNAVPNPASITTTQSVPVTVTVNGGTGAPAATGTVTLSYGTTYTSAAATLSSGSATITVPAGALPAGTPTLTATYTPDTAGSAIYNGASGTGSLTVNLTAPSVTVTPNLSSINATQQLLVTVTVNGGAGNPTPTGTVTLTSGSYSSGSQTLSGGSVQITVPAGSLAIGTDSLTATYLPDSASSPVYSNVFGLGSVKVTAVTPTVTVTPGSSTTTAAQSLMVTVAVSGGAGKPTPTGSVTLTSGSYSSGSQALSGGSVQITVPAGSLAIGTDTLAATYTPDAASADTYASASGTASVTVDTSVTVNQSSKGPAVTNQILGLNMAEWYDFTGSASTIVNAYQNAGIAALRWPGGSDSDLYHWNGTSATIPAKGTAPTPSACEGAYADSNANYLNFIDDLENAITGGFDIALTADYGTNPTCTGGGEPSEAANWVSYAYANGGTVSHVTVGNEVYGSWEEDMHASPHNPTTYADAVMGTGGYYDLIKAANSTTQVGVVVDADCTTSNGCTDGWDSTVLSTAAGYYDFVEYHFYPQYSPPSVTSDTLLVYSAAQSFTYNINTIKTELATANAPNTPIYVGELGANSANPGTQSWSITQGLYAGQILGEAMSDGVARLTWWIGLGNCLGSADITGTNGFNNNNSSLYGWQNTWGSYDVISDADASCPGAGLIGTMSPTAIAFQLFSYVAVNGQNVLPAKVAGDTNDVRAYAATNSKGTALVLFNLNETTAQTVVVTLSNESSSPGITEYTYDKEMYDYTNPNCATDPTCTYDPNHNYSSGVDWVGPTTTALGAQALPLTVTLQPWSMNVVIIQ
jgi:hypothetical protein